MAAVRAGRSRSLVVVGPAGIGKSWLCRLLPRVGRGVHRVATRGVETRDPSGLRRLVRCALAVAGGRLERLVPARAGALRGALRLAEAGVVDPFAVAVATLDLLAMAAEDAPVLVVIDDAPWVDAASVEALRFAARRLDADRVGFLFAARGELAAPFVDTGIESLTVGGLDTVEALGLVRESATAGSKRGRARAGGGRGRAPAVAAGGGARAHPGPDGGRRAADRPLSRAGGHAGGVRAEGVQPVGTVPVCAGGVERRRAGTGAGDGTGAGRSRDRRERDPGRYRRRAGCTLEAGGPRFSHPLARAAALEIAGPGQRRLAHEALARAWGEAGEPERATWHLAEGGDHPDAHVSSALAGVARSARARGAPGAAAEAGTSGGDGTRRRSGAAAAPGTRARPRPGRASLRSAGRARRDPRSRSRAELRADAERLQGALLNSRAASTGGPVLDAGAARIRGHDPARAAVMLCGAAFAKASRGEVTAAIATAEAAVALAGPLGSSERGQLDARAVLIARGGARGYPLAAARRARRPVRASAGRLVRACSPRACSPAGWRTTTRLVASSSARSPSRASEVCSATCRSR